MKSKGRTIVYDLLLLSLSVSGLFNNTMQVILFWVMLILSGDVSIALVGQRIYRHPVGRINLTLSAIIFAASIAALSLPAIRFYVNVLNLVLQVIQLIINLARKQPEENSEQATI